MDNLIFLKIPPPIKVDSNKELVCKNILLLLLLSVLICLEKLSELVVILIKFEFCVLV